MHFDYYAQRMRINARRLRFAAAIATIISGQMKTKSDNQ